jgi:hypothetical protein
MQQLAAAAAAGLRALIILACRCAVFFLRVWAVGLCMFQGLCQSACSRGAMHKASMRVYCASVLWLKHATCRK